jgi:hypothetical protein
MLSHRGDRLAMIDFSDAGSTLWTVDLSSGTEGRLARSDLAFFGSAWTPDDTTLVSSTTDSGKRALMAIDTRSGAQRVVHATDNWLVPTSIAPDGTILLDTLIAGRLNDIVFLPRGEGADVRAYVATPANESGATVSPDGRVVAYTSDAPGRQELYLDTFPEPGGARRASTEGASSASSRISTDGANGAFWRADGREIYFVAGPWLFACDVKTSPSIEIGRPHALFELPKTVRGVAPGPDGDEFFLLLAVGESPSSLTVVQDWSTQLEKHE